MADRDPDKLVLLLDGLGNGVEGLDGLAGVGGVVEMFDGSSIEGVAGCACGNRRRVKRLDCWLFCTFFWFYSLSRLNLNRMIVRKVKGKGYKCGDWLIGLSAMMVCLIDDICF